MKKQLFNLITLGIIFLLWFCLAFECKNNSDSSSSDEPTTRGGGCPSEAVIKQLLNKDYVGTQYATRQESLEFNGITFYKPEEGYGNGINGLPAGKKTIYCPIKILMTRVYKYSDGTQNQQKFDGIYYFFKNRDEEWVYFLNENLNK